jgi:hypothetical protein
VFSKKPQLNAAELGENSRALFACSFSPQIDVDMKLTQKPEMNPVYFVAADGICVHRRPSAAESL